MFPIGDDEIQGGRFPWVTYSLIALNVLVFMYELALGPNLDNFFYQRAVIPAQFPGGDSLIDLFTAMFMHGGWMHLIGNMLFLWVFGDNIEQTMGHLTYLAFYLAGGVIASLAHILFNPASDIPSLGASGAIAAVLGAYLVMFPRSQVRVLVLTGYRSGITRVAALAFLGIWGITQLFSGVASLGPETAQTGGGVAFWAHIGGFVFGLLGGFLFRGRAATQSFVPTQQSRLG
jgi:membrane associated rhomboid family serine protease